MNKSVSMMYLDLYSIKEYLSKKYVLIFVGILLIFAIGMDSPAPAIGMFMIYGMFYSAYPFAVGEKTQLDVLYASLPLTRKQMIFGRYLFALGVNLITGLISYAVCLAIALVRKQPTDPLELLMIVVACFFLYSTMEFLQFPFFFKLGYNKARLVALLPVVALAGLVSLMMLGGNEGGFGALIAGLTQWLGSNPLFLILLLLAIWLLLFAASFRLSEKLYAKREF